MTPKPAATSASASVTKDLPSVATSAIEKDLLTSSDAKVVDAPVEASREPVPATSAPAGKDVAASTPFVAAAAAETSETSTPPTELHGKDSSRLATVASEQPSLTAPLLEASASQPVAEEDISNEMPTVELSSPVCYADHEAAKVHPPTEPF